MTPVHFSPMEQKLINALTAANGGAVTHDALAEHIHPGTVWPRTIMASIRVRITTIREKIRDAGIRDRIVSVHGTGYRLIPGGK